MNGLPVPAPVNLDPDADSESAVLDRVFAALADPVRRAVLTRLDGSDLLVSELAAPFDISLQAVSRHIQVLVRAGLVRQERTGRISRCRLDAGPIFAAAVWLNRYSAYWQSQFDTLAALLEQLPPPQEKANSDDPLSRNDRKTGDIPAGNRRHSRQNAYAAGKRRAARSRGLPVRDD